VTVGSRVAIEPNLACGWCELCRTGHDNLCLNYGAIGVTTNGAIAEYVTAPVAKAYLLPDALSLREAALIEPVSCAVRGMHCLSPRSGDTFLIAGAGTMGLLLLQLALRGGASRIAVVDVNTQRLGRAEGLGATRTYTDIQQALADEPLGFNCVIDATGVAAVIERAFLAVKRGGKLMIFGVAPHEARVSLSPFRIYNEEITIVGSMAVLSSFQPALDLLIGGMIDFQAMLTAALPLEDFPKALDLVRRGEGVKTQILPNA
jgi:threonine dehydrogenase-like Zn-dependent dehydrogenase